MAQTIQLKRGSTASQWNASDTVLASGEPGVALDTGEVRFGNGVDQWRDLPTFGVDPNTLIVSVKRFGARGDSETNDQPAFNAAIDFLDQQGGGLLLVPPGRYVINGIVQLRSNISIMGDGATITKTVSSPYTVFASLSQGQTGYGSGCENVTISDLAFEGSFNPDSIMSLNPFALHHASNVVIERCRFTECVRGGHIADLNGCDGVIVRDSIFEGFNPPSGGYNRAEAIQLDLSQVGSVSASDTPGSFDWLATRNVVIENCRFLPLVRSYGTFPCPNPIGAHAIAENQFYENITVRNNTILDPAHDVSASYTEAAGVIKGVMHFPTVRGLVIENNSITQTVAERSSYAISVYSMAKGRAASEDPNATGGSDTAITPMACRDITITDNVISGFKPADAASAQDAIMLRGIASAHITDVTVRGNRIRDHYNVAASAGSNAIHCYYTSRAVIDGNTVDTSNTLVRFNYGDDVSCTNNVATNTFSYVVYVGPENHRVSITSNRLSKMRRALQTDGTSTDIVISNNVFTDILEAIGAISVAGSQRVTVQGNNIYRATGATSDRAIAIYNGTARDIAAVNNFILGPYTVKVGDTSGGTNIVTSPNY